MGHVTNLVLAFVMTLKEDLKQEFVCQDNPKYILSDSNLESMLVILLSPNRDPQDNSEQSKVLAFSTIKMKLLSIVGTHGMIY